jgi:K+-sensing histidine kinase KdpD
MVQEFPKRKSNLYLSLFIGQIKPNIGDRMAFGIGLAIADRAAQMHGGKIAIWNRATGGLTVEVSLPVAHDLSGRRRQPVSAAAT